MNIIGWRLDNRDKALRLPVSVTDCAKILDGYYRLAVGTRELINEESYMQMVMRVATWLTIDQPVKYGLILSGGVGLGKTTMLRAIADTVRFVTAEMSTEERKPVKPMYISAAKLMKLATDQPDMYDKALRSQLLLLDDVGAEESQAKVYGNNLMPMVDLLQERYDGRLTTIISTNMSYNPTKSSVDAENIDVTRKYGERITDRLRQYSFLSFGFCTKSKRYR